MPNSFVKKSTICAGIVVGITLLGVVSAGSASAASDPTITIPSGATTVAKVIAPVVARVAPVVAAAVPVAPSSPVTPVAPVAPVAPAVPGAAGNLLSVGTLLAAVVPTNRTPANPANSTVVSHVLDAAGLSSAVNPASVSTVLKSVDVAPVVASTKVLGPINLSNLVNSINLPGLVKLIDDTVKTIIHTVDPVVTPGPVRVTNPGPLSSAAAKVLAFTGVNVALVLSGGLLALLIGVGSKIIGRRKSSLFV